MPAHLDPLLSAALQMVQDEEHAKRQPPQEAKAVRQAATSHAVAVMLLAAERERAETRATIVEGGVLFAVLVRSDEISR